MAQPREASEGHRGRLETMRDLPAPRTMPQGQISASQQAISNNITINTIITSVAPGLVPPAALLEMRYTAKHAYYNQLQDALRVAVLRGREPPVSRHQARVRAGSTHDRRVSEDNPIPGHARSSNAANATFSSEMDSMPCTSRLGYFD